MPDMKVIEISEAEPGQRLAQDAKTGFTTLLAAGTTLTAERIKHLRARGVASVTVYTAEEIAEMDAAEEARAQEAKAAPLEEVVEEAYAAAAGASVEVEDFELAEPIGEVTDSELELAVGRLAVNGNGDVLPSVSSRLRPVPSLENHAMAYSRSVGASEPIPLLPPNREEEWFSRGKDSIRANAGLEPAIPKAFSSVVAKRLKRAVAAMSSGEALGRADLDELSLMVYLNLNVEPNRYLHFDDVSTPDDYVPAHTLRTVTTFFMSEGLEGFREDKRREFIKGLISHHLGLAGLVARIGNGGGFTREKSEQLREEYKSLYHELRRANGIDESVLETIFLQNEHFDGSGFPYRLSAEAIPEESQVMAISNKFSHFTLSKPKLPRATPRDACMRIVAGSGSQFNPKVVHTFLKNIGFYPVGSPVMLSDERVGVVCRQHSDALLRPAVRVLEHQRNGSIGLGDELDLRANGTYIDGPLREY